MRELRKAAQDIFSEEFLKLLDKLGADPLKEWEAFDYDFERGKLQSHLYGGWFVFCGELIEGLEVRPERGQLTFAFWFTTSFPSIDMPPGSKACAVEFVALIPWVMPQVS